MRKENSRVNDYGGLRGSSVFEAVARQSITGSAL